jgi:hypothetical protein
MKINAILLASLSALACVSAPASAGDKQTWSVRVETTFDGKYIEGSGSIGDARNSLDGNQAITCGLSASTLVAGVKGYCYARSAGGQVAACHVTSPQLLEVIKAITSDSLISFLYPAGTSGQPTCTALSINTSSLYAPKRP